MIHDIDALVASMKIHTTRKRFVLTEFKGEIVGRYSLTLTEKRCHIADAWRLTEQAEHVRMLSGLLHQLEHNNEGERLLLHKALNRARKNGWEGGESILDALA